MMIDFQLKSKAIENLIGSWIRRPVMVEYIFISMF